MEKFNKAFFMGSWQSLSLLVIVSFLLVSDLFFSGVQPQTFDEWSHLLTINGFYNALSQASFPVSWIDSVSNYGSPLGQISHQTTSYIGAALLAITQNTVLSYNLTMLLGSVAGTVLMYYFLKLHFTQLSSLAGAILFTFAPYRIANIYVRGALPEFFTTAFIPIILIGVHQLFFKKSLNGLVLIFIGTALLALSHPMMLIVGFSMVGFYLLYALVSLPTFSLQLKHLLMFIVTTGLGVMLASYYLLPLVLEIKYFHHGQIAFSPENYYFLTPNAFYSEQWRYYNFETVGIRENRLQMGALELAIIVVGIIFIIFKKIKHQKVPMLVYWWAAAAITYIFLMTPGSDFLYRHISFLSGIQFPWRFLIVLVFIAPVFLAYMIDHLKYKYLTLLALITVIAILRFPQLYGKNYVEFPQSRYSFAKVNPHGTDMSTMWSGESSQYPVAEQKIKIVEGAGTISNVEITPTSRKFILNATSDVRVVDYTFYFPGWNLFVNDAPTEIVYQDPGYRGVMTYRVPAGKYAISLLYKDTKIRFIGKVLSLVAIVCSVGIALLYLKLPIKHKKMIQQKVFT
jgi:hypothetical protein